LSADAPLSPGPALVVDGPSQVHTEAGKVVLTYDGAVTSLSTSEVPMTSMRVYVRVFMPSCLLM